MNIMTSLSETEIQEQLKALNNWEYRNNSISKEFERSDFKEAMGFVVRIGFEAEALGHHPTIQWTYNNVNISLQTHDAGDKVTSKDIDLAKAIDSIS